MNALFDDMYMKQHLSEYILFQAEQGYALDDIKKALLKFGYKKYLVKEILHQLDLSALPKKKTTMYSVHDLDEELRIYVQSLLIDYIVKEHKIGYSLEGIKKALVNYGHDPKVVDEAIMIISEGKVVDYRKEYSVIQFPQQIVASVTLFLIFAFLVFLSIATDTSIVKILPNFFPAFFAFVLINAVYFFLSSSKLIVALPLFAVLVTLGAFLGGIQYGFLGTVPGSDMILVLNAVLAFLSCGIVCAFSKKGKDEIVVRIKDKKQKKILEKEEHFVEDQIHVAKIGAALPKEPYHSQASHSASSQNGMLHYLREEIDRKPIAPQKHSVQQPAAKRHTPTTTRMPVSSLERLSEHRKNKEQKEQLKKME